MHRIEVDTEKCCAYGNCVVAAPDTFGLREDEDTVVLLKEEFEWVPPHVYRAIRSCPVLALKIVKVSEEAAS